MSYLNLGMTILIYETRRSSIRATLLPNAILLTMAHRAAVSMMAKECIVA